MSNTTNNDNPGKVAAFTPGQWRVQPRFCTVYKTTRPDGTGITTAIASPLDGHGEFTQEEREANARLIASSPSLFAVVRDLVDLGRAGYMLRDGDGATCAKCYELYVEAAKVLTQIGGAH